MEIDFNPGRIPNPEAAQPVARPSAPAAAQGVDTFPAAASLQSKLKDIPLGNPQQVEKARAFISDGKYPPDYIVDRIAALLAPHLKP